MPLSFYGLLEASLLMLNGIAVLNRERFLKKVFSFSSLSHIKFQLIFTRFFSVPLIAINILVILFKLLVG
ncbi:unnamed protein product [Dracunculus medinensis]|uniref:Immediate early response 3-interacting protein 1 n=1 Tax=Dracunculus medinensis TaxID=318479 RepID=A0A0N4UIA4_DRAME|nr:unnamed protein product [Dracunculus medinensis]